MQSFEEIQSLLHSNLSDKAVTEFCQVYPLDGALPIVSLRRQITQFLSDFAFGRPVHLALEEMRNNSSSHPTISVRPFRVKYRNPFQGHEQAVSHHCVELIYVFDAFHEALREVDAKAGSSKHAELVCAVQKHWTEFITGSDKLGIANDNTIVWDSNGKTTVKTSEHPDIISRLQRFRTLDNMGAQASALFNALTGID